MSANVAPRTLLVGTAAGVAQMQHMLELADPRPAVVGCLLPVTLPQLVDSGATASAASLRAKSAVVGRVMHKEHEGHGRLEDSLTVAPDPSLPKLLGRFNDILTVVRDHHVEQVLVSLPVSMGQQVRDVGWTLDEAKISWRFLPTLADQLAGRTGGMGKAMVASPVVDPLQLIDRVPHPLDETLIRRTLEGRRVLITGSGGSIGSELARIAARFGPAKLILVERSENALFEIDRQIARLFPTLARAAVLHDVTDRDATRTMIDEHRPEVIFHAAAHKHVPMMEDHPAQAVENNFYGTRSIADAADAAGCVERFVMISSDKAVNPSSVMGATKRLAELYIQWLNQRSGTLYSMVRFGNVLGSACSVLPIWTEQLQRGGPITVTHPDMTRYFMTIPEAAGLVIQSAAFAGLSSGENRGGEVFLLDMGEPIRIVDLARRFVKAQGLEPGVDIAIDFTGVRPGEKLFEELAYDGEDMAPTPHKSVRLWRTTPPAAARMGQIIATFDRLRGVEAAGRAWRTAGREAIVAALRWAIPEMVRSAAG